MAQSKPSEIGKQFKTAIKSRKTYAIACAFILASFKNADQPLPEYQPMEHMGLVSSNDQQDTPLPRGISLQGGGNLTIAELVTMQKLEQLTGKRIHEIYSDVFSISAGNIISTASWPLVKTGTPLHDNVQETINLFLKHGGSRKGNIFEAQGWGLAGELFGPNYSYKNLLTCLQKAYGDLKLSDLEDGLTILVQDATFMEGDSFLENLHKSPILGFSSDAAKKDPSVDFFLAELLAAGASAPTYFEIPFLKAIDGTIYDVLDAGNITSSPSEIAAIHLQSKYPARNISLTELGSGHQKIAHEKRYGGHSAGLLDAGAHNSSGMYERTKLSIKKAVKALGENFTLINPEITDIANGISFDDDPYAIYRMTLDFSVQKQIEEMSIAAIEALDEQARYYNQNVTASLEYNVAP